MMIVPLNLKSQKGELEIGRLPVVPEHRANATRPSRPVEVVIDAATVRVLCAFCSAVQVRRRPDPVKIGG
jgi:hypothetical protein